jgi:hypothetical protein
MIDIKIQEVFDFFIKEALWRNTMIKDVKWYYAENGLYVFRYPAGYHYGFCFINAKSPEEAAKYFIDKFWTEQETNHILETNAIKQELYRKQITINKILDILCEDNPLLMGCVMAIKESLRTNCKYKEQSK